MHQLPARIERRVACEPLDRPAAGGGEAVVDLGGLFGDMDVQRPGAAFRERADRLGARRAQRMDRDAGVDERAPDRALQRQHILDAGREAALIPAQLRRGEAGAFVQHRQQRQADAGVRGRVGECLRHRRRVGVAAAVQVVLQVVELADVRVAAGKKLEVEVRGDRPQLGRRDAQCDAVHAVAPRPEVVVRRVTAFGQASEGALEGVAVRVDHAREHRTGNRLGVVGRGDIGHDLGPGAVGAGHEQHTLAPAPTEPGTGRPQPPAHGCHPISVSTSDRSTGNTVAARGSS